MSLELLGSNWWHNNWKLVLVIAIIFALLDKGTTALNINAVKKNYPSSDPVSIEKNPIQKFFWQKFGVGWGSFAFAFISVGLFFLGVLFISVPASIYSESNKYGIALYVFCMIYSLVIMNNIYFFLRYSKILT